MVSCAGLGGVWEDGVEVGWSRAGGGWVQGRPVGGRNRNGRQLCWIQASTWRQCQEDRSCSCLLTVGHLLVRIRHLSRPIGVAAALPWGRDKPPLSHGSRQQTKSFCRHATVHPNQHWCSRMRPFCIQYWDWAGWGVSLD